MHSYTSIGLLTGCIYILYIYIAINYIVHISFSHDGTLKERKKPTTRMEYGPNIREAINDKMKRYTIGPCKGFRLSLRRGSISSELMYFVMASCGQMHETFNTHGKGML